MESKLYAFVVINYEDDGSAYVKGPVVLFNSRKEGIDHLHAKYLDTRLKVDADSVELSADYFENDGVYRVEARNGIYEGFLKEADDMKGNHMESDKKVISDLRLFAIGDQWGAVVELADGGEEIPVWAVNGNEGNPPWFDSESEYERWYNLALEEAHKAGFVLEGEAQ